MEPCPYSEKYFDRRERSPTFKLEVHAVRRALAELGRGKAHILEIGAGSGALARQCGSEPTMWVATDRDTRHFAGSLVTPTTALGVACDARRLPFAQGSFDAVVAQHVIEHFDEGDISANLLQWRGVLRKNGICVVVTPNRLFPNLSWFDDPTHHRLLAADELVNFMEDAGFSNVLVWRLIPWLGSERAVYLAARLQRFLPGALQFSRDPSLSLLAVGSRTEF